MNPRKVIFVITLSLILGGGVLYKSPVSLAAENPASAPSGFLSPLRTQAASVYTAVQDFWTNLFSTTPPPQVAVPTAPAPQPPSFGGKASKSPAPERSELTGTPEGRIFVSAPPVASTPAVSPRVLSGITATDLETQIATLRAELLNEIARGNTKATQDNNSLYLALAPMNRINNLSSVTISNPTITGATVSSGSLSGTFSGSVSGTTGTFTTLGVGTSTPADTFAVNGVTYLADVSVPSVTTNRLYSNSGNLYWAGSVIGGSVGSWTLSGSDVYRATGKVGIGTTSPYAALSVVGETVSSYFTATSTTKSTFPYASTTALTVSGNSYLGTISSGIWNGTAVGLAYGGTGATTATGVQNALGLMYSTSTDITNRTRIATWGDSLTENLNSPWYSYPSVLGGLTGYTVYNGGYSGQNSTYIKNQMLAATDKYGYPMVIWSGRNNYTQASTVLADIAAMVAASTNGNYIVMSILNGDTLSGQSGGSERLGGTDYTNIINLNNQLATIYGSHYIDIRAYLVSQYNPALPQDVIDHNNDVPPTSIRRDNGGGVIDFLHLSPTGYAMVSNRILQSINLLQASKATVLTADNLPFINLSGFNQGGRVVLYASSTNQSTLTGELAGGVLLASGLANTATGFRSLMTATSSSYNTAHGAYTLQANTSGSYNTANGISVLTTNTTGGYNTAIGAQSMYYNIIGSNNSGLGYRSLFNNTGDYNTAVGSTALTANLAGAQNVAIGAQTLYSNQTGNYNVAIGVNSLFSNVGGGYNVAIGKNSLQSNTGSNNTGVGYGALLLSTANNNTAMGYAALGVNVSGADSTAVGLNSLSNQTTGTGNTALGRNAGIGDGVIQDSRSVIDNYATFLGYRASRDFAVASTTVLTNITAIGKNAIVGASNTLVLGGMGVDSVKVGIGTSTPYAKLSINANSNETNTTLFAIASSTASATTTLFSVLNTGNVGVGTAAPLKALQVVGDIRVGTSGTNGCVENFAGTALTGVCSSDATLKTNIQPMGSVLTDLTKLTPSTFYWNDIAGNELHNSTTTQNYGLIAQEVLPVFPQMVATTTNGYLGVNYSMLPILTLQGLKELDLNLEGLASTTAMMTDTTGSKTFVGRFFDRMTEWLADAANGLTTVFANVFNAKEKICVDGECLTKSDIKALLDIAHGSSQSTSVTVNSTTATTTPIVISINGNNPATINVGETYGDLGALITAPDSAKNFGIKASLDGGPELDISQISLDTSVEGTHTIIYSVVDQNNATTTAERVVNVIAPAPVSTPLGDATTTIPVE